MSHEITYMKTEQETPIQHIETRWEVVEWRIRSENRAQVECCTLSQRQCRKV